MGTNAMAGDLSPVIRVNHRRNGAPDMVRRMVDDITIFTGSDLADIAHYLCALHGRYPGVLDHLADRMIGTEHYEWLSGLAQQFAGERALLTNMTVAAGPVMSIASGDNSAATIEQLRCAIDLLARSDRDGCTLGSAGALLADWIAWRPALEAMLPRLGLNAPYFDMAKSLDQLSGIISEIKEPRQNRAIVFGIDQLTHQHDQFWLLLERRQKLRNAMLSS